MHGWVYGDGYGTGRVYGWVYGRVLYRVLPSHHALLEESARYSEAGPGGLLQGAWSGWYLVLGRTGGGTVPAHPCGARSCTCGALPGWALRMPPWANKGEIP